MITKMVIETGATESVEPIVFPSKKEGSLHFCVDYRKLNAVTVPDTNRPALMDESFYSLGKTTVFSPPNTD